MIAFIGLGNMGRGMCRNLVLKHLLTKEGSNQNSLIVFNRTRSRSEELQAQLPPGSVEIADSVDDAVTRADIIYTCLSNDDVVEQVLRNALHSHPAGKLFVECSTIHRLVTKVLTEQVLQAGARFVACPVSGAPDRAEAGQLICVECGLPFCKGVMGRDVIDLSGKTPDAASTLKVLGNSFNMVEVIAEGHVLAEKAGLGNSLCHEYVEKFFPGVYASYSTRMITGDYWNRDEPLFTAQLARKDIKHALNLAETVGTRMPGLEVVDRNLAKVDTPSTSGAQV
ncbi:NAD binding domain of 6-phosphogluconate dehydrogenase-domain-containing protein [Thelonectria olida]|uniref:NAD binding domain of 6-phosphogluconate dehydrogenase-domain-containing protein n=1 Tax=Thelonectria olida TaxID=1576542 RepID=A0A9P9AKB4_9HYPO|nr:NAD binding domain of 6-phosphogluconate dehydrogenase-domain-containing protein [Thelonectria olida]